MKGAREYADLFETGTYGKLHIEVGRHARGKTFHIFANSVEVYGVTGGSPGWTESYGWLEEGPWKQDFYALVEEKKAGVERRKQLEEDAKKIRRKEEYEKKKLLLSQY